MNKLNCELEDQRAENEAVRRYKRILAKKSPNSTVEIFVSGFRYGVEYGRTGEVSVAAPVAPVTTIGGSPDAEIVEDEDPGTGPAAA